MAHNLDMNAQKVEALWTHLHLLVVLDQQGSFTAAATRLEISKTSMSEKIAELERAAGVPLVQRTTRSVRLTEAGQRLVESTRQPFEQIAHSFAGVRELSGVPSGRVRVTAPVAFARQQVVPRIPEFLRLYPEIRIELDLSDKLRALATDGFDLAIRHTAAPPDTHVAWALCKTRSVLVASPVYLRRRGIPERPEDLSDHDCLHYPRPSEALTWSLEEGTPRGAPKRLTVPISGSFAANNSEALRDAAVGALGIALIPDFSALSALRSGELVEVLPRWRAVDVFAETIYAIRPYASHVPRAVVVLVEWLRATLGPGFSAA